ncbi:hypothetical protein J3R30DRAFT_3713843 [Lentinula aciculospora]|uniref:Uncharacterized protein n=1 Tax=Lentinula aciculospora TaxID=153920 RepID=A0A9W8ZX70_9AGAR|nr:hypothetical protein J3R30DRAFT_3713843 [Lentinula aciculospora]
MFSTRTPLLLNLDYRTFKSLYLFAVLTLIQLCILSTANPLTFSNLDQASPSPRADTYTMLASLAEIYDTPRQNTVSLRDVVKLVIKVAETSSFNDSDTDTDDPDSSLTDTNAIPPRPSRATIAFIVLAVGLCLLSIYYVTLHPPINLIDDHIRPTISHISDHLPNSLNLISQRLAVISHRLSAHIPSFSIIGRIPSALLPTSLVGTFKPRKSRRRRGPGSPTSFRVGEGRLVQWAQEDMGLLEMDSEAVDFMVNAEDPAESEELVDEYIPLSVGMGWKGRLGVKSDGGAVLPVRNYGTATSW